MGENGDNKVCRVMLEKPRKLMDHLSFRIRDASVHCSLKVSELHHLLKSIRPGFPHLPILNPG
jgi:hypothetical protein